MNKAVSVCDANSSGLRKRGRRAAFFTLQETWCTAHAARVKLVCAAIYHFGCMQGKTLKSESVHTKSEKLHSAHRIIALDGVMDKYTWITKERALLKDENGSRKIPGII